MKRGYSVMLTLICCSLLIACSRSEESLVKTPSEYAQQLFEAKNPYIGDNSADIKILELLNIQKEFGNYHIELEADQEPNIIKLNFEEKPILSEEFQDKSFLILALIKNANEVQWSYPDNEDGEEVLITWYMNEKDATTILNKDIKSFDENAESLQELLDELGM